jgi:integrase
MTANQSRRHIVCEAIRYHVARHGAANWHVVRSRFPDLPEADFWRWLAELRAEHGWPTARQLRESASHRSDATGTSGMAGASSASLATEPPPRQMTEQEARRYLRFEAPRRRTFLADVVYGRPVKIPTGRPRVAGSNVLLPEARMLLVGDLMARYDAEVLSRMKSGDNQRRSLHRIVGPLGAMRCAELRSEDIQAVIDDLAVTAAVHANRILGYFSAMCGWARTQGLMAADPAKDVRRAKSESPRRRRLSLQEIAEIWLAAFELGRPFGPIIQLMILTMAGRDDAARLRRIDLISLDGDPALLTPDRTHDAEQPFHIPLSPAALKIIEAAEMDSLPDGHLIFSTTGRTPPSGWGHAKARLDRIVQQRRLQRDGEGAKSMPAWTLNDLRNSFFDLAVERLGAPPWLVGRCLNRRRDARALDELAFSSSTLTWSLRRGIMLAWAQLIEREVQKAERPDDGPMSRGDRIKL